MPDTVNIVPYTGPALDCAGPGYFEGVCTAAGEPQQNVMIQAVHSVTGAPAGHTVSGPDGRWRLEGVNPTMDFDILYRGEAIGKYGQIHQKRRPILDNNISFYPNKDPHIMNVDLLTFVEGGELKTYGKTIYENGAIGRYLNSYIVSNIPPTINDNWFFKEGIETDGNSSNYIKYVGDFNIIDFGINMNWTLEMTIVPSSKMRGKRHVIISNCPQTFGYTASFIIEITSDEFLNIYTNNGDLSKLKTKFDIWDSIVHLSIVVNNKTTSLFINGKMKSSVNYGCRLIFSGSNSPYFFRMNSVTDRRNFIGVFHNIRITGNVARYTKDFYPPNKQFPIIGP